MHVRCLERSKHSSSTSRVGAAWGRPPREKRNRAAAVGTPDCKGPTASRGGLAAQRGGATPGGMRQGVMTRERMHGMGLYLSSLPE